MNLMKMATGFVTPVIASKVAGMFGVPEGMARKVLSAGIPLVLGAVMKRGSMPGGADALGSALGGLSSNPLESLGSMLGGEKAQVEEAAKGGGDLLSSVLGGGAAGTLASKLAGYAGVDEKAAGGLMGLASGVAMGGMKKVADDQGLDTAGLLKLLGSQKDEIAAAIPSDLASQFKGSDLFDGQFFAAPAAAAATAAPKRPAPAAPPPPKSGGGAMRWIIGLVILAVLAWLAMQIFGGGQEEEPVAEEPAATEAEPAATEEAATEAEPAATEDAATETAAANPLEVDGVDIGASVESILDGLGGTLAGITDSDTAQSAVEALTQADTELNGLESSIEALPDEGKSALAGIVSSALPALQEAADGLLGDSAIAAIVKPALDGIFAKLQAMAG